MLDRQLVLGLLKIYKDTKRTIELKWIVNEFILCTRILPTRILVDGWFVRFFFLTHVLVSVCPCLCVVFLVLSCVCLAGLFSLPMPFTAHLQNIY